MTRWLHLTVIVLGVALTGCTSGGGWRPFGSSPSSSSYSPSPSDISMSTSVTTPSSTATPTPPTAGLAPGGVSFVEQPVASGWSMVTAPFTNAASAVSSAFAGTEAKSDPTSLSTPSGKVSSQTYVGAAKLHEQKNDLDKADAYYRKAIETDPKDLVAYISYGRMCHRQGKIEQAVEIYRRAITVIPSDPVAYNDLALCYGRQEQWGPAIETITRAVQLEPTNKLYRGNAAMLLVHASRSEEALAHLTAVHPADIAHYNLGYLLMQKGEPTLATQHFAKALEANPNLIPARQMLARMHSGNDAIASRPQVQAQPTSWPAGNYVPGSPASGVRVSSDPGIGAAAPASPSALNPALNSPAAYSPAGYPGEQVEGLPPVN